MNNNKVSNQCLICWTNLESHNSSAIVNTKKNLALYKLYVEESQISNSSPRKTSTRKRKSKDTDNSEALCSTCTESCEKILYIKEVIEEFQNELNTIVTSFRHEIEKSRNRVDIALSKSNDKNLNGHTLNEDTSQDLENDCLSDSHFSDDEPSPHNLQSGMHSDTAYPCDTDDLTQLRTEQSSIAICSNEIIATTSEIPTTQKEKTNSNIENKKPMPVENSIPDFEARNVLIVKSIMPTDCLDMSIDVKEEYMDIDLTGSPCERSRTPLKSGLISNERNSIDDIPERLKSENIRDIRIALERIPKNYKHQFNKAGQPPSATVTFMKRKAAIKATNILTKTVKIDDNNVMLVNSVSHESESEYSCGESEAEDDLDSVNNKTTGKKHKCSDCELSFRTLSQLKSHTKVHTTGAKFDEYDFQYKCGACQLTFASVTAYKQHLRNHADGLDSSPYCPVCDQKFTLADKLLGRHMKTHIMGCTGCINCGAQFQRPSSLRKHKLICAAKFTIHCDVSNCTRRFKDNETLKKHKENHDNTLTEDHIAVKSPKMKKTQWLVKHKHREFKCGPCKLTFKDTTDFIQHLKSHPDGSDTHIHCPVCGKRFAVGVTNRDFAAHLWNHSGEKPYKCTDCELAFVRVFDLHVHRIIHTNAYQFTCDTSNCRKKFKTKEDLKSHQKSCENSRNEGVTLHTCEVCGDVYEPTSKKVLEAHSRTHKDYKPFKCTFEGCEKKFRSYHFVNVHIEKDHLKSQRFPCDKCDRVYFTSTSLRGHKDRVHTGNIYICELCGKEHKQKASLHLHMINQHNQSEKRYKCDQCGKAFSTGVILAGHIKHTHKKEYDYTCEVCGKHFKGKSYLLEHSRKHTLETLDCQECGQKFLRKFAYKAHMRTHSGNLFECETCGMKFHNSEAIRMHKFTHTGVKEHKCEECGKCFARKDNLKSHMRHHTGERPFFCNTCGNSFSRKDNLNTHVRKCSKIK